MKFKKWKKVEGGGLACYQFDPHMGFWGVPNLKVNLGYGDILHDVDGNRNYSFLIRQSEKSIVCLGGSHTWGGGVRQDLRYTDLLAKMTGRSVINMGHCSLGLDQVCLAIINRSAKYQPKMIVVEQYPWAVHRILNNYVNGYVRPYFYFNSQGDLKLKGVPIFARYKFFRRLIGAYYAFRKEFREFELGINIKDGYDPSIDPIFLYWKARQYDAMYSLLDKILSVIADYCRRNEIKLIFALGAIHQQFGPPSKSELVDYELPKKRLIECLNKNKIAYVDMTDAMMSSHTKEAPVIFDDGHINTKGHQVFSEVLYETFVKKEWIF
jgi:hypothetical protein